MEFTQYHAKYFAFELTKRWPADSIEGLTRTFVNAQVDLNPHQVEASLFAFRSPLSKGAILADEVGLGKTIEAGIVISQKWAERKRRILVITPANLRKQWHQELSEKFFLPCRILESKPYNQEIKKGNFRPLWCEEIVICSLQFARTKADDIRAIAWDLVVVDEAHRLRNVYKPSNVIAKAIKDALKDSPKLLLTATPLQNSLLELFGLVSIVDEHVFGDLKSFREQFTSLSTQSVIRTLRARLKPVCHRTLRRQVVAYVPYTKRHAMLQPFTPEESEDRLYNLVSEYLQRENLQALPSSQRMLMTLVLRKLLASSSFAIAGALASISKRLQARLKASDPVEPLTDELREDYEALDETADEWNDDESGETLSETDRAAIEQEIADLQAFRELAVSITQNAKGRALLIVLEKAFQEAERLGALRKAIVFTESRRTQDYLLRVLADTPYKDSIVLFNGSNTDEKSRSILKDWLKEHAGTDRISGSRSADMRSALVDYFREKGQIMIATEAGAEGINLQFCSLVVNYDLPWNPQRIEQRIGRCHRYGQKQDVVVVNLLNRNNEADQRVFRLLSEKFQLFEGVFGASDEVLGAIESGVDFERRIASIYQTCRTSEEINASFDALQLELSAQIDEAMTRTRQQLLENFDDEVREKLRISDQSSRQYLGQYEQMLMALTRYELAEKAEFKNDSAFVLKLSPLPDEAPTGLYELPRRTGEAHLYRIGHPLAQHVLQEARSRALLPAGIEFDLRGHHGKISILEPFAGKSGSLKVELFTVESLDQAEDYLLLAVADDSGVPLEEEAARRLFAVPVRNLHELSDARLTMPVAVDSILHDRRTQIQRQISQRNLVFFEAEAEKLDGWAEDLKVGLERDIKDLDRQIKEARRAASSMLTLEEKLAGQKQVKALESLRNSKRRSFFEAQDEVDRRRDHLIAEIEGKLQQRATSQLLFTIRWSLV